jgi:hypothetical protein
MMLVLLSKNTRGKSCCFEEARGGGNLPLRKKSRGTIGK